MESEISIGEMVNNVDFYGKLFAWLFKRMSGNPKELKLLAKVDVIIQNNLITKEFSGITAITEYTGFARRNKKK